MRGGPPGSGGPVSRARGRRASVTPDPENPGISDRANDGAISRPAAARGEGGSAFPRAQRGMAGAVRMIGMGRVIAIANQKGGVGKTTTAINLGASLAIAERRTLIVDCDPQANATSGLGIRKDIGDISVYDCFVGGKALEDAVRREVHFSHLDVVPSSRDLAGAEVELIDRANRERVLRQRLGALREDYDYILIDSPPSLGLLTLNALAAADTVLIPIQCEFYALEGLSQLLNTVRLVQRNINQRLGIEGVLLTMYDSRLNLSRQVVSEAREYFGAKVFDTVIPRNVRLAEAPSFGKPIAEYDVLSSGARGYLSLARELIERDGAEGKQVKVG